MKKKGQANPLGALPGIVITLILVVIVMALGGTVLGKLNTQTDNADAQNITAEGADNIIEMNSYMPTVVTVIMIGIVLTVLIGAFVFYFRGK